MKKVMLLASFVCALSFMATAQTATAPAAPQSPAKMKEHGTKLVDELGLSPVQATQFKAIEKDANTQAKAIRQDSTLAKADKHAKEKANREAADSKIKALLSPDQYAKWTAIKEEKKESNKEKAKEWRMKKREEAGSAAPKN